MRKVSVLVDEDGKVVASYIPPEHRSPSYTAEDASSAGLFASAGRELLELELPDDEAPTEPGPDFLDKLQQQKDRDSR